MKLFLRYQIFIFTALLFAGPIIAGTSSAICAETVIVTGTGSSIATMELMAGSFQKKHPDVNIKVLPSIGSTGGIKAVDEDKIDIGLSYRPLKPKEQNPKIIAEPYGRTAFIFGVQDSNPATDITLSEVEEIYSGKRGTWPDGSPIRLVLRPVSDGFSEFLAGISPALKSASEKAHSIPGVMVAITDQEAGAQIQMTPGSFGTTSSSIVAAEKLKIKALSVGGTLPTLSNVSNGKYPYVMTLYLIYKQDKYKGAVKDFIEFIFTSDGLEILSDNGHITLNRLTGK